VNTIKEDGDMSDENNKLESMDHILALMDESLDEELLHPERVSLEAIEAELEEAGFSPGELEARAARLAARKSLPTGAPSWQARASKKLDRSREILARRAPSMARQASTDRAGLLRQLDGLRAMPGAEGRIQAYFRNKSPDEVSDEELASLIEDLSLLHNLLDPID
jgi:hypothetical protein